jgi:hypothetical protein
MSYSQIPIFKHFPIAIVFPESRLTIDDDGAPPPLVVVVGLIVAPVGIYSSSLLSVRRSLF